MAEAPTRVSLDEADLAEDLARNRLVQTAQARQVLGAALSTYLGRRNDPGDDLVDISLALAAASLLEALIRAEYREDRGLADELLQLHHELFRRRPARPIAS